MQYMLRRVLKRKEADRALWVTLYVLTVLGVVMAMLLTANAEKKRTGRTGDLTPSEFVENRAASHRADSSASPAPRASIAEPTLHSEPTPPAAAHDRQPHTPPPPPPARRRAAAVTGGAARARAAGLAHRDCGPAGSRPAHHAVEPDRGRDDSGLPERDAVARDVAGPTGGTSMAGVPGLRGQPDGRAILHLRPARQRGVGPL